MNRTNAKMQNNTGHSHGNKVQSELQVQPKRIHRQRQEKDDEDEWKKRQNYIQLVPAGEYDHDFLPNCCATCNLPPPGFSMKCCQQIWPKAGDELTARDHECANRRRQARWYGLRKQSAGSAKCVDHRIQQPNSLREDEAEVEVP